MPDENSRRPFPTSGTAPGAPGDIPGWSVRGRIHDYLDRGTGTAGPAPLARGEIDPDASAPIGFLPPVGAVGWPGSPGLPSDAATTADGDLAARHTYGPDGPDDPPSWERAGDDPERYGDLATLAGADVAGVGAGVPRLRLPRPIRVVQGLAVMVVLGLIASVAGFGTLYSRADLRRTNAEFTTNNTSIFYRDGKTELTSLSVQNRTTIPGDEIPQSLKDAVIAAENRSFWQDAGISLQGMARAVVAVVTGDSVQGGSTITQQYVKLMYLSPEQTLSRKAHEIAYALKLTRHQPKERILEDYLNTVFFGRDAYGVQAAAQAWFGVDAKKLTLEQSAVLAAVIQNASIMDPQVDPDNQARLEARYRYVLDGMLESGTIDQADHDKAAADLPDLTGQKAEQRYNGPQGFLVNMVEAELSDLGFEQAQINGGGLQVTTTFDPSAQKAAEKSVATYQDEAAAAHGAPRDGIHGALTSVDNNTGEVLALYGGDDFVKNSRNWATTPRMTGSTFKTFGVVAGLRDGYTLWSTLNGNTFYLPKQPMPVRNEFNQEYGQVSLLTATANSINTAFVDMVDEMNDGPKKVMKAANDAGAPSGTGWGNYPRMVLGEPEVSPLEMAGAYATIVNGGVRHQPHVVREVRDLDGTVLYQADSRGDQTIENDIARDTTYALEQVTSSGTAAKVSALGRPVAGKTGTAGVEDIIYAGWFIGSTTRVTTSVMYVAGDDGQGDLDPYRGPWDQTFFGNGYPASTWLDYMKVVTKDDPYEEFPSPAYVQRPRTDG